MKTIKIQIPVAVFGGVVVSGRFSSDMPEDMNRRWLEEDTKEFHDLTRVPDGIYWVNAKVPTGIPQDVKGSIEPCHPAT